MAETRSDTLLEALGVLERLQDTIVFQSVLPSTEDKPLPQWIDRAMIDLEHIRNLLDRTYQEDIPDERQYYFDFDDTDDCVDYEEPTEEDN